MFLFRKKKGSNANSSKKVRKDSPEITSAKEYLNKTHPTLLPRESGNLLAHPPFNYVGCSQKDSYTRYHFSEGTDTRIIYTVLCDEERKKIIELFNTQMKEVVENYQEEFIYKDSLNGMFVGETVKHRFFSNCHKTVAFMTDDGDIDFPPILESENMD